MTPLQSIWSCCDISNRYYGIINVLHAKMNMMLVNSPHQSTVGDPLQLLCSTVHVVNAMTAADNRLLEWRVQL